MNMKVNWGEGGLPEPNKYPPMPDVAATVVQHSDVQSYIVELPSGGVFYENKKKEVKISPLVIAQVRQLESSQAIQDKSNQEREIANIVGRSIHDFNVFDLTYEDYRFLLYWLRLNSFQRTPYTIQWAYTPEGETEERQVLSTIKISDFNVTECDPMWSFDYGCMTVRDKVEILALPEEERKYAEYACVLKGRDIQEKIQKLDLMPADYLSVIKLHIARSHHGVHETVTVEDKEAAVPKRFTLPVTFAIADFFP